MYDYIHTDNDRLREEYISGCELSKYGFPILPKLIKKVEPNLESVPINLSNKCLNPKNALCHFFVDDNMFHSIWTQPNKQLDTLRNYKWVTSPDFSCWGSMPLPLQMYNKYRIHAISWYMLMNDINIIPTVTWNNIDSYEWCFDGLQKGSVVALSGNGCSTQADSFRRGFDKMCEVLEPIQIVWVGTKIDIDTDIDIVYYDGYSQQIGKRGKK